MSEHDVVVDEPAVLAAIEARAGGDVPAPTDTPAASPAPPGWVNESQLAASFLAHKVCPAWDVPIEVQQQWAEALAGCANQLMPGGLANIEKWGPWGKLFFASVTWVMCGFDMEQFGFKPLHIPPAKPAGQARIDDNAEAAAPKQSGGPGFSTGA